MNDHSSQDQLQTFAALREHFNETETAELGYAISVIKGWNLLNLSLRNQIPEVPAPGF